MYNKKTCKQTFFRIPKCLWEALHLSWIHQPHRQITTGAVTLPQLPGRLHWSCTDPALILHSCQLSPWTRLSWDDAGECHKQGWPGNSVLCFEHPGVLERCFMSKAVPKSKAPFPAVSNAAPQPLCKEGREATGGEWAADREEPAAHTAPAPMCQAAAPVALGAALNLFQSTCHCPS